MSDIDGWGQYSEREQTVYDDLNRKVDAILRALNVSAQDAADDLPIAVQRLIARGQTIYAIKELREQTGCSLKEAHDAVYAKRLGDSNQVSWLLLGRKLDRILAEIGTDRRVSAPGLTGEQTAEIEEMLTSGNFIGAVMVYRDYTGASLEDAQDILREINARLHDDE